MEPDPSSELSAILTEVDRFVVGAIEPAVARPESPIGREAFAALLAEARAFGVVAGADTGGAGLWEEPGAPTRSVRVLTRVARANAGVALAVHLESLAQWLTRRLRLRVAGVGIAAVQGRFGLGRGALARLVTGAALDEADTRMLVDTYGDRPRLLTAPHHFEWLVVPRFDGGSSVRFLVLDRASLVVDEHPHAHGLDELATFSFALRSGAEPVHAIDVASGASLFAEALGLASVGLLAVALGAAEHAHELARGYARTRRQGGKIIDRHAAVQQLLASSRAAIETVRAQLESASRTAISDAALPRILALRAEGHPLLCRGANDALQVFGGLGYMRDTGVEKLVRDLVHLRTTCGSPPELALVVAEWERANG